MMNQDPRRTIEPVVTHSDRCEAEGWYDPASGGVQWWTLLSGDRTPSHAMSCGVVKIGPGTGGMMITHQHAQPEIYHVLSGEGIVTIGGEEFPVREGSTLFIPGGVDHSTRNTGEEPLRMFYVFAVDSMGEVRYQSAG